ncbi:MAG: peptide ABC transporter substrate-binding protein [Thermomicrobiales bacterium]
MSDSSNGFDRLEADVLAGRLDRRQVLKRGAMLGLSAPVIAGLLAACGGSSEKATSTPAAVATKPAGGEATKPAEATKPPASSPTAAAASPTAAEAKPTETQQAVGPAGGGGQLRLLWWQAPTIMNPHLSTGTKDFDASRVVYEPLADFDSDGNGLPSLAVEMPTLENGGVSKDGLSVTWKLRKGVKWHDGTPFTADDVVFTWQYASDKATAAVTIGNFANVDKVESVDETTVKIIFKQQNPAWFDVFTGPNGMILPKHVFGDYVGEKSRDAAANLKPIGTGPFKIREFRPGDVAMYDIFEDYWDAGKPFFDSVELKGGGDAQGAARAVLQSNEGDWAWNVQAEPSILNQMAQGGVGIIVSNPGSSAERIMINFADPNTEVDGARSEPSTQHPIFKSKDARNAIALSIQRDVIAKQLYGEGSSAELGKASSNNLNAPGRLVSPNTTWEYNIDKAKQLLANVPEAAGYKLLYQTSINSVRQKTQEIVKQSLEQVGFVVELKSVDSAVYFASDAGNPDTYPHFYADLEMYTNGPSSPYPISWAERFRSDEIAAKANSWAGTNITRYNNPEFDKLHDQARVEMDPAKQVDLFVAMNDMSVNDFVEVPIVHRAGVACASKTLAGYKGTMWSSDLYDLKNWKRQS